MDSLDKTISIASNDRIQKLIDEAALELNKIQPEIEYLEQCHKKLIELKEHQFKLNSLIMSLKSVIKISNVNNCQHEYKLIDQLDVNNNFTVNYVDLSCVNKTNVRQVFLPDQAISNVKNYLRTKNNLNYEIFKAVVFNSGIATTDEIKQYLVENKIRQPKTGKTFEDVELKEISSRANYLVRKDILISTEPGVFRSVFGWCDINNNVD